MDIRGWARRVDGGMDIRGWERRVDGGMDIRGVGKKMFSDRMVLQKYHLVPGQAKM